MNAKNILAGLLVLLSGAVLTGLLLNKTVWGIIVCYWTVVVMKNIYDMSGRS